MSKLNVSIEERNDINAKLPVTKQATLTDFQWRYEQIRYKHETLRTNSNRFGKNDVLAGMAATLDFFVEKNEGPVGDLVMGSTNVPNLHY